jgi:hypothetical protein
MTKATDKTDPVEFNTNIHAIFQTDESLEEAGAWVVVNDLIGLKVKIRRLRSDAVIKAFERIVRETYGDGLLRKPGEMNEEQSMNILKRQLAEAVMVDWAGVRDTATGKEVPYSTSAALQMMGIKDFREFVYQAANERDTFREQADKDAEKN